MRLPDLRMPRIGTLACMFHCPRCQAQTEAENLDAPAGAIRCVRCGRTFNPKQFFDPADAPSILTKGAPKRCSLHDEGGEFVARWPAAKGVYRFFFLYFGLCFIIFPLPFIILIFWNDPSSPRSFTLIYSAFFGAVALMFCVALTWLCFGGTEVRIRDSEGSILHSIGPFRWRARFEPQSVSSVRIAEGRLVARDGTSNKYVVIGDNQRHRLAMYNDDDTRRWLAAVLHDRLVASKQRAPETMAPSPPR